MSVTDRRAGVRIAVDAMGGDHAPAAVVEGAVMAARAHDVEVILVGDPARIEAELHRLRARGPNVHVYPAREAVAMDEHPVQAIRRKRDSSLRVAFEWARAGSADAVVSAGNSGAVMAGALLLMGRLEGIERPAVSSALPTVAGGRAVLVDSGANTECRPVHLLQWALCADAYARRFLGIAKPKVALVSNGEEPSKGTALTRAAWTLLETSGVDFVGYVEGRDVFSGRADILVTDGFTGNVLLKTAEGAAAGVAEMMRQEIERTAASRVGYLLMRGALSRFRRRLDYAEYGGAPLLGVDGVAVLAHGASNAVAIKNAIRVARDLARDDLRSALTEAARKATALAGGAGGVRA